MRGRLETRAWSLSPGFGRCQGRVSAAKNRGIVAVSSGGRHHPALPQAPGYSRQNFPHLHPALLLLGLGFGVPGHPKHPTSTGSCGAPQSQSCGKNGLPGAPWGSGFTPIPQLQGARGSSARAPAHAQLPRGCSRGSASHGIFFFCCWNFVLSMGFLPSQCQGQPGHSPEHGNARGDLCFP